MYGVNTVYVLLKEHINYPAALTKPLYKINDKSMVQIFIINSLPGCQAPYRSCLIYMLYVYMILNFDTRTEVNTFKHQIWLRILYIQTVNYLSYLIMI